MNSSPRETFWEQSWERISLHVSSPEWTEVAVAAAVIVIVLLAAPRFGSRSVTNPAVWPKFVITQTHEGSHALTALLCRHGVTAIRLERDHSGVTHTIDYGGFGSFLVSFNGYLGPGLTAVGMGILLGHGYPNAALTAYAAVSVLMLLFMRNLLGFTFVASIAVLTGGVVYYGSSTLAMLITLIFCWYLALGGIASAVEQFRVLHHTADGGTDAEVLREITRLPAGMWAGVHLLAAIVLACVAGVASASTLVGV